MPFASWRIDVDAQEDMVYCDADFYAGNLGSPEEVPVPPLGKARTLTYKMLRHPDNYPLMQAVRSAEWKYIRYWPNGTRKGDYTSLLNLGVNGEAPAYEELFHLTTDPAEQHNLAKDEHHQAQLAEMRARCTDLLRDTRGDPQTVPSTTIAKWMNEVPTEWKAILPLLSTRGKAEN